MNDEILNNKELSELYHESRKISKDKSKDSDTISSNFSRMLEISTRRIEILKSIQRNNKIEEITNE